jgi:hypothetical protein
LGQERRKAAERAAVSMVEIPFTAHIEFSNAAELKSGRPLVKPFVALEE